MTKEAVLTLLALHFAADFFLQSHWMASNKSKDSWSGLGAMLLHVSVYTGTFMVYGLVAVFLTGDVFISPNYCLANGGLHLATDMATSRITSRLYARKDYHWFFVVLGFDQLIHFTCLIGLYGLV